MTESKNQKAFLIYGAYSKVLNGARHHGNLQTSYRIVASSWLLATFIAIGFILSTDNILPFDQMIAVALICALGITGLYLIWYEDTIVQDLLLDINVLEALRIETKHKSLPQIHHRFLNLYKRTNAKYAKVIFYVGCTIILFFIITISLAVYFSKINQFSMFLSIILTLLINYLSGHYMVIKAGKIEKIIKDISHGKRPRT